MAYSVTFTKASKRQFDKLPRPVQQRLGAVIEQLTRDPRPAGVVKLSGEDGLYRVRGGDYRAVYQIQDERLLILVVKVGHRREVYRDH
ncbi:type II toxin-antitoxin system RelE family toxin [Thiocystis violascens]|uniref:Cytotoxic translational repressor of toxin-antitoxin stability system n=1 Tax=Thiocystis violascens (strain ATCC 17096 / DSM 198 / 6111) TaxID=765911 RepID=I3YHE2_THIV6|nr:type II toxin-antitoxin system RelE/ParE family toxin [Thiocystis violascens]AFL76410.1 cytotoxic translational repressor of toxin-antitoxin stability system [Thiocystis violascens DSM 198]